MGTENPQPLNEEEQKQAVLAKKVGEIRFALRGLVAGFKKDSRNLTYSYLQSDEFIYLIDFFLSLPPNLSRQRGQHLSGKVFEGLAATHVRRGLGSNSWLLTSSQIDEIYRDMETVENIPATKLKRVDGLQLELGTNGTTIKRGLEYTLTKIWKNTSKMDQLHYFSSDKFLEDFYFARSESWQKHFTNSLQRLNPNVQLPLMIDNSFGIDVVRPSDYRDINPNTTLTPISKQQVNRITRIIGPNLISK